MTSSLLLQWLLLALVVLVFHASSGSTNSTQISQQLFWELEELARIVDISYCVGTAGLGIKKPFQCASRCGDADFADFELVTVSRPSSNIAATLRTALLKLFLVGMEHRPVSFRLVRLYCPLALTLEPPAHNRFSWYLLAGQHHCRPFHNPPRIRTLSGRR